MQNLNKISPEHPKVSYGNTGILIINLGTPESCKWIHIRSYLKEFLSDKRVIEANRVLWFFVLNFIILNLRPHKTAKNYKKIWLQDIDMSPLKYYTETQKEKLQKKFKNPNIIVEYAMRYGKPSIQEKINHLKNLGCDDIIILPLYPQYAAPTTASVCDEVFRTLLKMRWQPNVKIVHHYESDPNYIKALANSLRTVLRKITFKPDVIITSYHGIPEKYFEAGDPYHCYCHKTTRLLKEAMKIKIPFMTTFQSRFGPQQWLKPYTDITLKALPAKGIKKVLVLCPGFASDCIETLEEIEIEAKDLFFESGGLKFKYVPCLNDNTDHINLLYTLVKKYL